MTAQNIRWAWRVLFAKNYVIADDTEVVCHVRTLDPHNISNLTILGAQQEALTEIRDRLTSGIEIHATLIEHRLKREGDNGKKASQKSKSR